MARIGLKGLTIAPFTSGGSGSACVYGTGQQINDVLVQANVTLEYNKVKQFADDHQVEGENNLTGATLDIEAAHIPDAIKTAMLGYTAGGTGETGVTHVTTGSAPYIGVGYITSEIFQGVKSYVGYWFHKTQWTMNNDNNTTKGEQTAFNGGTLNGELMSVVLTSGGKAEPYMTLRADTEAAVLSWLKTQANITTTGGGSEG